VVSQHGQGDVESEKQLGELPPQTTEASQLATTTVSTATDSPIDYSEYYDYDPEYYDYEYSDAPSGQAAPSASNNALPTAEPRLASIKSTSRPTLSTSPRSASTVFRTTTATEPTTTPADYVYDYIDYYDNDYIYDDEYVRSLGSGNSVADQARGADRTSSFDQRQPLQTVSRGEQL